MAEAGDSVQGVLVYKTNNVELNRHFRVDG
jgi:hypothetical protein